MSATTDVLTDTETLACDACDAPADAAMGARLLCTLHLEVRRAEMRVARSAVEMLRGALAEDDIRRTTRALALEVFYGRMVAGRTTPLEVLDEVALALLD